MTDLAIALRTAYRLYALSVFYEIMTDETASTADRQRATRGLVKHAGPGEISLVMQAAAGKAA